MQILKVTVIDWCDRRSIRELYVGQCVKIRLDQGETRSAKIGRGARQRRCLSPILFDWYSECLNMKALEGFGYFKIRQIILTVKYADDLLLLAEKETLLQG
jgi:hypothetical protein